MRQVDYISLSIYMFGAQIRSDFNRYYLGTIWWFVEPCLYVAVFYFVFVNFRSRDGDFLYQLMCGLATWKWITSLINQGANSIVQAKGIINSFNINPFVFPVVAFMVNTFKYFVVLGALLLLLYSKEAMNFAGILAFLYWFITAATIVFSYQLILSTIMPFLPDLKIIVSNMMMLLMFTSGVIFPIEHMAPKLQEILQWNPFVHLIDGARAVFLRGEFPDQSLFGVLIVIHFLLLILGYKRLLRLKGEFPKRMI